MKRSTNHVGTAANTPARTSAAEQRAAVALPAQGDTPCTTRAPIIRAWFAPGEISAVLFAGLGGQSLGEFAATGRSPDIAVNHWDVAIAVHKANHPTTKHYIEDVHDVDPLEATGGRPVGINFELLAEHAKTHPHEVLVIVDMIRRHVDNAWPQVPMEPTP